MKPVRKLVSLYYKYEDWPVEFERACNDIVELRGGDSCPWTAHDFEPIDCYNECENEYTECWMMYYICNATVPKV